MKVHGLEAQNDYLPQEGTGPWLSFSLKAPLSEAARKSTGAVRGLVMQTLADTLANDQAHGWIR